MKEAIVATENIVSSLLAYGSLETLMNYPTIIPPELSFGPVAFSDVFTVLGDSLRVIIEFAKCCGMWLVFRVKRRSNVGAERIE